MNLATKIPTLAQSARAQGWTENTRIRVEGSRNLVDAAIAAGALVFVQESIAFLYGEHGDAWIDATTAEVVDSPVSEPVRAAEANAASLHRRRRSRCRAPVRRVPGTRQLSRGCRCSARPARASSSIPRVRTRYRPTIAVDDAAAAVVAALDAPAGTYDIVDDEPITRRDVLGCAGGCGRAPAAASAARVGRGGGQGRTAGRFPAGLEPALPCGDRMEPSDSQPARRGRPDRDRARQTNPR